MASNYAALLVGHKIRPLRVELVNDRYPDENEIVVRNAAVAINQLDWKIQDYPWTTFKYPLILGVYVAGEVVDVGCDVDEQRFNMGDRVIGHALAFATEDERHGGFQNYTVLQSNMATPIPPSLSFEKAVVLPLGVSTASAGLFQEDCLALPKPSLNPRPTSMTLLVWGGSSSGDVVKELKDAFRGRKLAGAFDTIGNQETLKKTADAVMEIDRTKMVVSTIDWIEEGTVPDGIVAKPIMAIDIRGDDEEVGRPQENVGKMVYEDFLPEALRAGKYQPEPLSRIVGNGLGSIQEALKTALGGVSATKLVVTL